MVQAWRTFSPRVIPRPHPRPRNIGWLRKTPWFEVELLPAFRKTFADIVDNVKDDREQPSSNSLPTALRNAEGHRKQARLKKALQ